MQLYYDTSKKRKDFYLKILIILIIDIAISCDNNSTNKELLRIPLLKDVFQRYPTIPINIDIKENNDELIRQVIEINIHFRIYKNFSEINY